jgi:predicted  nucleic acid-binding Zn-ribbon protein
LAKLGGDFKSNPFKAVVDLVDHDGLRLKRDITLRGVAEEMLTMQCLVSVDHASNLPLRISLFFFLTSCLLCLQAFLRSTILYCYMRKVSTSDSGPENLQGRLSKIEEQNANLKKSVAKHEEDLRVLAEHSTMMEYEASDASKARDRAEAKLSKVSEEIERLRSENVKLREDHRDLEVENAELLEDHSILKEDYKLLEEKHSDILEQLAESQASVERAVEGKVIAEEKFQHFNALYKGMRLELKEVKAKATDYLHQLSFASRVRDSAWADGLHLGFETFRAWWRDPAQKMDLNSVNIEDIHMTKEAIRQLISLGREEMPDAVGIDRFAYRSGVAPEGGEAEKEHDGAEEPPPAQDPPVKP